MPYDPFMGVDTASSNRRRRRRNNSEIQLQEQRKFPLPGQGQGQGYWLSFPLRGRCCTGQPLGSNCTWRLDREARYVSGQALIDAGWNTSYPRGFNKAPSGPLAWNVGIMGRLFGAAGGMKPRDYGPEGP